MYLKMIQYLIRFQRVPIMVMLFRPLQRRMGTILKSFCFAVLFKGHANLSKVTIVVMKLKDHHGMSGGLANAVKRMDHRWHAKRANGVTMIHWRQGATATPHPISVYSKLNDCQVTTTDHFAPLI
jgi:hypothetical protein